MKHALLLTLLAGLCLFAACEEEPTDPVGETGFLSLSVQVTLNIAQNGRLQVVPVEDYQVTIFDAADQVVLTYARFAEVPDQIELEEGDYYVRVNSNNLVPAAFDNPYYVGQSALFTISKGEVEQVIVTAELANVKVTINYSDNVLNDFDDWSTEVALGVNTLVFAKGEGRSGYFDIGPLTITATLSYTKTDGSTELVTVSGAIADPQPKDHYTITIDAVLSNGTVGVDIIVDDSTNDIDITFSNNDQTCFMAGQLNGIRYVEYETPIEENELLIYYDESTGRISRMQEQEEAPPSFEVTVTYNPAGQVSRLESIDGANEYLYHPDGRVAEKLQFDNLGGGVFEQEDRLVYTYTGTQLTRRQFFNKDGGGAFTLPSAYEEYIYPNTTTNNPTEVNFVQTSGVITETRTYTYDLNPNPYLSTDAVIRVYFDVPGFVSGDNNVTQCVEEEFDSGTGALVETETTVYTYTYDGAGKPLSAQLITAGRDTTDIIYSYCPN